MTIKCNAAAKTNKQLYEIDIHHACQNFLATGLQQ